MANNLTPRSDVDLCKTCSYALIRESYQGRREVFCDHMDMHGQDKRVRGQIVKCSGYRHKNQPDSWQLEKIAWIITTDPKGKVGFRPWKDMSENEREDAGVRRN